MTQYGTPCEYYEISLEVPRLIHDPVCDFIVENYAEGVVLADKDNSDIVGIQFFIPANDNPLDENFPIHFTDNINEIIKRSEILFDSLSPNDISIKKIINAMWEEKFRQSIKPIFIDNVVIHPPWIETDNENKIEIVIEPKMAFGTGSHETTRLCLLGLLEHVKPGSTVFDLGCGSGILSILSAKLGAKFTKGVDIDMVAVENARENIVINNVADKIEIKGGSIENGQQDAPYDIVVANIIKTTILELFPKIFQTARENGIVILSGLLVEDREAIENMLTEYRIAKYEIKQDGQWLVFTVYK
ncbi:MAG: 50S ribosomal protein L11 methyltransferase [Candidatus Zixiibacteriota bacterium]